MSDLAGPAFTPPRADCCMRCAFYVPDGQIGGETQGGNCHRMPPTIHLIPTGQHKITGKQILSVQAFFAPVDAASWCGEFQSAMTKTWLAEPNKHLCEETGADA